MSNRRKNFHYHYAEQYETRQERIQRLRERRRFGVHPAVLVVVLLALVLLGVLSTTFSVYVTTSADNSVMPKSGGLVVSVRNDIVRANPDSTGITSQEDVAAMRAEEKSRTNELRRQINNALAETNANADIATTGASRSGYYITGGTGIVSDGWGNHHQMEVSDGGYYCYWQTNGLTANQNTSDNEFVITAAANYNTKYSDYSTSSLKGSSPWTTGFWKESKHNNNFALWTSTADHKPYIVTFFPDTELNTTNNPVTYVYNSLPNDVATYALWNNFHTAGTGDADYQYTTLGTTSGTDYDTKTYSATITIPNANCGDYYFKVHKTLGSSFTTANTFWYGHNSHSVTTTGNSDYYTNQGSGNNINLTSVPAVNGSYTFTVTDGDWHDDSSYEMINLAVTYPTYYKLSCSASSYSHGNLFIGDEDHATPSSNSDVYIVNGRTYYVHAAATNNYEIQSLTVGANVIDAAVGQESYTYHGTMGSDNVSVSVVFKVKEVPHFADDTFTNQNQTKDANVTANFTVTGTVLYPASGLTAEASVTSGDVASVVSCTYSTGSPNGSVTVTVSTNHAKIGTATITVNLKNGADVISTDSFTVTVSTPTLTFANTTDIEELRTKSGFTYSSPSPTPVGWSWSKTSGDVTLGATTNQSTVDITAGDYVSGSNTAQVQLVATYGNGYQKTYTANLTITQTTRFVHADLNRSGSWDDFSLKYDAALSTKYSKTLYSLTKEISGGNNIAFTIRENGTHYKNGGTIEATSSTVIFSDSDASLPTGTLLSTSGSDCQFAPVYEGFYTFVYDIDNHKLYMKTFPAVEYYVRGFGDWSKTLDRRMTSNGNANEVSVTLNTSGTYINKHTSYPTNASNTSNSMGFKVYCNDGTYYGVNGTITHGTNYKTLTSSGQNVGLTTTYSGDYTFTFNTSTKVLTVTYPTRSVTVTATYPSGGSTATETLTMNSAANNYAKTMSNTFVQIVDNEDDSFTVTHLTPSEYQFTEWSDSTNTTTYTLNTTASDTTKTLGSTWNYKGYKITLHNENDGTITGYDNKGNHIYEGEYTYGTGATLPTASDFSGGTNICYEFDGWYDSGDNLVTAIAADATGEKEYWAHYKILVTFKENITGNAIANAQQYVAVGGYVDDEDATLTSAFSTKDTALAALGFVPNSSNLYNNPLGSTQITAAWYTSSGGYITRQYLPEGQQFTITVTPNGNVTGSGTSADPYVIGFGAAISVHAAVTNPKNSSNIKYIWKAVTINGETVDEEYTDTANTNNSTFERADIVPMLTKVPSGGYYQLQAKATYDSPITTPATTLESSVVVGTLYYSIPSPLASVAYSPANQLIYSSVPQMTVSLNTHSSITSANETSFKTNYKVEMNLFDKTSEEYDNKVGEAAITGTKPNFSSIFFNTTVSQEIQQTMSGVNYPRFDLFRPTNLTTPSSSDQTLDSSIEGNRVVVGSNNTGATRPVFIKNTSGTALADDSKRAMVFCVYSGALHFQTIENVGNGSQLYRVEIPSGVDEIWIANFDKTQKYALPELDTSGETNTLDYTHTNKINASSLVSVEDTSELEITAISEGAITVS